MATPMDQDVLSLKRDIGQSGMNDDDHQEKRGRTKSLSDLDVRLTALARDFLLNKFDPEVKLDAKTKELLIKFGAQSYKYIAEKEMLSSIAQLSNEMKAGFAAVNERLGKLETKEQPENASAKLTYANMVTKLTTLKPEQTIEAKKIELEDETQAKKYTVIEMTEKVDDDGFQLVKSKLSRKLKGQHVRVDRILKTSSGNVSLEFPTCDAQKKVENILNRDPLPGVKLRSSSIKQASVAIRGIPIGLSVEEVKSQLKEENPDHPFGFEGTNWNLRLVQSVEWKGRFQLGKITAPISQVKHLLDNKKVYLEFTALKVDLWKPGHSRCNKCFRTGHVASSCNGDVSCVVCGGNHSMSMCDKRDRPDMMCCIVCVRTQQKNHRHKATLKDCPILHEESMQEYKKVFNQIHG